MTDKVHPLHFFTQELCYFQKRRRVHLIVSHFLFYSCLCTFLHYHPYLLLHFYYTCIVYVEDYCTQLICGLSEPWTIAAEHIKSALSPQKFYDRGFKHKDMFDGDCFMIYMSHEAS